MRRAVPAVAMSATAGLGLVVLWAGPAAAHAASGGQGPSVAAPRAVAVALAFAGFAAVAGPALSGSARHDRARAVTGRVGPAAAVAVATGIHLHRGALVVAVAAAAVAVVAPDGLAWRLVPAGIVVTAVTSGAGPGLDLQARSLGAVHVLSAAAWLGLVVEMAVLWWRDAGRARRTAVQLATPAVALVGVVAASGGVIAANHLGDARLALGSWWGRGLAIKVGLVVVAAVLGGLVRRGWAPRVEGSLLGVVAAIGLALAAVGGPLAGRVAKGPLLVADDAAHASVVVTPLAPGDNTVLVREPRVGATALVVDGRPVRLEHRSDGLWVGTVHLAAGRHRLGVGATTTSLSVQRNDAPTQLRATIPSRLDPDCLDRLAGYAAAVAALDRPSRPAHLQVVAGERCDLVGAPAARPVDWTGATARALAALRARGATGPLVVVGDGDGRGPAAARALGAPLVPSAAVASSSSVAHAGIVLVATSRASAVAVAEAAVTATHEVVPVVLAPWLLDADLVSRLADASAPVLVATLRDPTDATAVDYRIAEAKATGGGVRVSAAGLEAYLDALAAYSGDLVPPPDGGVFSLSHVAVLPVSVEDHPTESGWARGVAMIRVA